MEMHNLNHVSQFFYFMWNHWTEDACIEIYGPDMGKHFWDKYVLNYEYRGADYAVATLYASMSEHYRNDLLNAALKYYENQ